MTTKTMPVICQHGCSHLNPPDLHPAYNIKPIRQGIPNDCPACAYPRGEGVQNREWWLDDDTTRVQCGDCGHVWEYA